MEFNSTSTIKDLVTSYLYPMTTEEYEAANAELERRSAAASEPDQIKRQLDEYGAALQFLVDMPFGAPLAFARCQSLARATLKKWQPAPAPAAPSAQEDA